MAFLMAASASLEGVSKMSCDKDSTEYLAMANNMLSKYRAAAQALTVRQQSLGEPSGKAEDKCHQYMLIMVSMSTAPILAEQFASSCNALCSFV